LRLWEILALPRDITDRAGAELVRAVVDAVGDRASINGHLYSD
jgi:hypothetical protein